jgi:hypothetical protein
MAAAADRGQAAIAEAALMVISMMPAIRTPY